MLEEDDRDAGRHHERAEQRALDQVFRPVSEERVDHARARKKGARWRQTATGLRFITDDRTLAMGDAADAA